MSRRQRNVTIVIVLCLLAAVELGYQSLRRPGAWVVVNNQSTESIDGLVVTCGESSKRVGRIHAGESAKVYLAGRGNQPIVLKYSHKGSALQGFQVSGFDLTMMSREHTRLVINIRSNEFERYQEEDEPSWLSRAGTSFLGWLESSLESP